jgi:hypothetical protein
VELDAFLAQNIFGGEKIFAFSVATLGDDVGVLAEEQDILDRAGFAGGDETFLQGPRFGVADQAQVDL